MSVSKKSAFCILALVCVCLAGAPLWSGLAHAQEAAAPVGTSEYSKAAQSMKAKSQLQMGDEGFWSFAISTLIIRFVGIFIVLGILQVGMQIAGRVFQSLEKRGKAAEARK